MKRDLRFAVVVGAVLTSVSARADDGTVASKLDAIEKRLAHMEAIEVARGPKPPFAFTLPTLGASGVNMGLIAQNCRGFGYGKVTTIAAPPAFQNAPGAVTVICYE